ncbi:hypothetical protein BDP27DRAFT_1182177, partial [Rhodocollybia butyracea]
LHRSSALGGGSRSVVQIAKEIFNSSFRHLNKNQKKQVYDSQDSEQTWRNNHRCMNCRSTSCLQVSVDVTPTGRILPCSECQKVLSSKHFRSVLNHKAVNPENYKHVNERFRNTLLAHQWAEAKGLKELIESAVRLCILINEDSIYTRFAQGAIAGKYDDCGVFLGLLDAMVKKQDKEERGVGMQNFQYRPDWDQFMHIAS